MLEAPTEGRALAGRRFQQDAGQGSRHSACLVTGAERAWRSRGLLADGSRSLPATLAEDFIQCDDDSLEPFYFARRGKGPGVSDNPRDAERCRPLKLIDQGLDGFIPERLVRAGQVDQVRIVGQRAGDAGSGDRLPERLGLLRRDRLAAPLIRVLGEYLDHLAAGLDPNFHGLVVSACDRLMGAENCHFLFLLSVVRGPWTSPSTSFMIRSYVDLRRDRWAFPSADVSP